MKIIIDENSSLSDIEIIIKCPSADESVMRIFATLKTAESRLSGIKNGQTFPLSKDDVLYFDTADKKTFIYTAHDVYETPLRLYEIEELLEGGSFFRASKSCIINLSKVKSLRPDFGGRLLLTMSNAEQIQVSRQYSAQIKAAIGM